MDNNILWGWNPKLDIPSALSKLDANLLHKSYSLITVVDSTSDVGRCSSLPAVLAHAKANYSVLGRGIVVKGSELVKLVKVYEFFNGFDEVWLFSKEPSHTKPDAVPLTSDIKLQQGPPVFLGDWMYESGSFAGLGDGDGLNWMTISPPLAQSLSV